MRKMNAMHSLIDKYQQRNVNRIDDKTVYHLFRQLVLAEYGRYGAAVVRPLNIRASILFVSVADSAWAQEIWMRRSQLRTQLNHKIGYNYITRIVTNTK